MTLTRETLTTTWTKLSDYLSKNRWIVWVLFALGLARGLLGLLAYPPALGADVAAYYFYAQRLAGLELSGLAEVVPPLYPVLILISFNWLGSAYPLVALQWLMSAALAPLYYDAIKRIDPLLALVVGLVVLFDYQTALMFNFISTEPLYVLLLALSFNLFMRASWRDASYTTTAAAGVSLLLLLLTRAVGRFLIIPLALVHLLRVRSWRHTLALIAGFGLSLGAYSLLSQLALNQVEGVSSSTYMVTDVVLRNRGWLDPANGPATAEFVELDEYCNDRAKFYICYQDLHGTADGLVPLMVNTALEVIRANLVPMVSSTWANLNEFLKLSGQQLGFDESSPGEAQCRNVEERINALTPQDLRGRIWAWGAQDYVESNFEVFRAHLLTLQTILCPPLPDLPAVREVVDFVNFRYRSLGRPNPMLWYGALLVLALVIPWARRRYLTLVLAGSTYLFNHALISAVIHNVQPRYVVVTNPFRAMLLLTLVFIIAGLLWQMAKRVFDRRRTQEFASVGDS